MSDIPTPRTDAVQFSSDPDCYGQTCQLVRARFAQELERDNAAKDLLIQQLKAQLSAHIEVTERIIEIIDKEDVLKNPLLWLSTLRCHASVMLTEMKDAIEDTPETVSLMRDEIVNLTGLLDMSMKELARLREDEHHARIERSLSE